MQFVQAAIAVNGGFFDWGGRYCSSTWNSSGKKQDITG